MNMKTTSHTVQSHSSRCIRTCAGLTQNLPRKGCDWGGWSGDMAIGQHCSFRCATQAMLEISPRLPQTRDEEESSVDHRAASIIVVSLSQIANMAVPPLLAPTDGQFPINRVPQRPVFSVGGTAQVLSCANPDGLHPNTESPWQFIQSNMRTEDRGQSTPSSTHSPQPAAHSAQNPATRADTLRHRHATPTQTQQAGLFGKGDAIPRHLQASGVQASMQPPC